MSPTATLTPPENSETLVPVSIDTPDLGSHIEVFDGSFRPLASGVGSLTLMLPNGYYKARFKAGDRSADLLFEVEDTPVALQGPALKFSSPIPLTNTSNNHEFQYGPSRDLASKPPIAALGIGGGVFIFARDSKQQYQQPPAGPAQWQGLCISNSKHVHVFDVDSNSNDSIVPSNGFASVKLDLDPGLYFLEQPDCVHPQMVLKLPFVVCEGWCTHIYVDSKDACQPGSPSMPANATQRVLDLGGAAMVMLRLGASPHLDEEVARLSEIARQGLMRSVEAVSARELDEMLEGRREFPMLGLYAAHVMLGRPEPDWIKVGRITQHLERWLGSRHPDVDVLLALCARHGLATRAPTLTLWPPLLAATWELAIANGIKPGDFDARGDWQRQYRVGGSMWSCLYAPKHLADLAAGRRARKPSLLGPGRKSGEIVEAAKSILEAMPQLASDPSASWKRNLTTALKNPDPDRPPFEQAVRRRVLDLLDDEHENVSLGDIGRHVDSLAQQFQVPSEDVGEVIDKLAQKMRD